LEAALKKVYGAEPRPGDFVEVERRLLTAENAEIAKDGREKS
jgi:hypothetical protein